MRADRRRAGAAVFLAGAFLAVVPVADQAVAQPAAAASPQRGATLFKQRCASCHTIGGKSLMGPDLAGVVGRKAGVKDGYAFSKAMQGSGLTWTPAKLDEFLAAPGKVVRGTRMMTAVAKPSDRADIVAYLRAPR